MVVIKLLFSDILVYYMYKLGPSGLVVRRSLTALEDQSSIPDAGKDYTCHLISLVNTGGHSVLS